MKHSRWLPFLCALMALAFSTTCVPYVYAVQPVFAIVPLFNPSPAKITASSPLDSDSPALWIAPATPDSLRRVMMEWNLPLVEDPSQSTMQVVIMQSSPGALHVSTWVYALVAPFPTVTEGVSSNDLMDFWRNFSTGPFGKSPLLMSNETFAAFSELWGTPADGATRIVPADQLLDIAWKQHPSWAIIPFEDLQPRWKVLAIDGQSPIMRGLDLKTYPLVAEYRLESMTENGFELPSANYDPSKMTTMIVTGVTALVRATASTMELKGITYPGRDIRDVFRETDIMHISNEIPFFSQCPFPDPKKPGMVFCSNPRYMDLLTDVGMDVVELTGNHFADFGADAMKETLDIYKRNNIPYFGGGIDLEDSLKPALLEDHGNKIAFVGCNKPDVGSRLTASKDHPGAAPCDYEYLTQKIGELHEKGYVVVSTFQWSERYDPLPYPDQVVDFHLMADSGADIVSGSQSHFPQVMEMYNDSFIHYGLGNLFFDQMDQPTHGTRREFADRYIIYDGHLVNVQLLTFMLEDFSRPRPMTETERNRFLLEYFERSGMLPLQENDMP